MLILSRCR